MTLNAKIILSDVPDGQEFVLHNSGNVRLIKNLFDLESELKEMSDSEFSHHVSAEKNDFSIWIREVFKDDLLAHDLKHANTKNAMLTVIHNTIKSATEYIEKQNKKIIEDELHRVRSLSKKNTAATIAALKKDIAEISENISIEESIIDKVEDSSIVPWSDLNPVHPHARIIEFIFGLTIGITAGLILALVLFG
jgi:hypothetical protein